MEVDFSYSLLNYLFGSKNNEKKKRFKSHQTTVKILLVIIIFKNDKYRHVLFRYELLMQFS